MEVLGDMAAHRQYLCDAIEFKGLEGFWDLSLPQPDAESQASSAYRLGPRSHTGLSENSHLQDMVAKLNVLHMRKPTSVSNIRPLSCQPCIKKATKGRKLSTNHALKREIGFMLDEHLLSARGLPVLPNHSSELSTSQMYLGDGPIIPPNGIIVNSQNVQDSSSLQSYGDGELPPLYGDSTSEEDNLTHMRAKSPVDSASISLGSSEGSTSNEVLGSSEIHLMDTLYDQSLMMGYVGHDLETWLEDPFLSMAPTIESYTNDGCFINDSDPNIKELGMDTAKAEALTHATNGSKAAHAQEFLSHTGPHLGNNSISLPPNESMEGLKQPRIDFEEVYVQAHNLVQENKILIEGSLTSSGCTQFCLPRPISGPSAYCNHATQKLQVVNRVSSATPDIYTCMSRNEVLDQNTGGGKQPNDVCRESPGTKSACNYTSNGSLTPQILTSVKSEYSMDACPNILDLGSNANHISRLYDVRSRDDPMEVGLVHLLTASAEALMRGDVHLASVILVRLRDMVSCSDNTMQRVISYFVQGLEHQMWDMRRAELAHHGSKPASQGDVLAAFQILHEIFPYIKFGHFTANQAILEAVQGANKVHIVDFEILEGIQWPAFMQALVTRKGASPPEMHITALCRPNWEPGGGVSTTQRTCKRLAEFASAMHLPFSYSLLIVHNEEIIDTSQIKINQGEALVVNCMVHLPHMPRHTMAEVASFVHAMCKLSPSVITLVEEELGCSAIAAASFFSEALYHFHAICDSLEACLPSGLEARMLVERVFLAPRINSVIEMWCRRMSPCQVYGVEASNKYKWSTILHSAGFKCLPLSLHNQSQAKLLLGLHRDGFKLEERSHHLVLGWQRRPLYAASVWNLLRVCSKSSS